MRYPVGVSERAHHQFSYAEYLARERETGLRHEFLNGQVFAMTGGTPEHARLIAEVTFTLRRDVDADRCRVFSSDLRVRIPATGLSTYPDVAMVCGNVELDADDPNAVTNPSLLVEVLSPSTEAYDRGEKWAHYRRIGSLQAYVLVAPVSRRIEAFVREGDAFVHRSAEPGEALTLEAFGLALESDALFSAAL